MKRVIGIISLGLILFLGITMAQKTDLPYSDRWKNVEKLAEKQLPESALKEVESILVQAQKEKKSVEVIKAMVYKMRFNLEKNPDEAPALIKDFEAFTEKSTDPAERALLHYMTAELYANYYQKDQWTINNRTQVTGTVPDDMKEWTKNIFFDKINKHLTTSLENSTLLQKTDALKFAELIEKGVDSRELQPTLFDFLSYKKINLLSALLNEASDYFANDYGVDTMTVSVDSVAVDTVAVDTAITAVDVSGFNPDDYEMQQKDSMPSLFETQSRETYSSLIEFRKKEGNKPALLYAELQQLIFDFQHSKSENREVYYLKELNELEKEYANDEAVVEVLAYKANYYLTKSNDYRSISYEQGMTPEDMLSKLNINKRKAYDICEAGINRFPNYKRIQLLQNIVKSITLKSFRVNHNETIKPNSNLKLEIGSTNVDSLKLSVYRINATALQYFTFKQNSGRQNIEDYPDKTLIETHVIKVDKDINFGNVNTDYVIKSGDFGIYEVCLEDKNNKNPNEISISFFTVSNLTSFSRSLAVDSKDIYVTDRVSGIQQKDVKIKIYTLKWNGKGYGVNLLQQSKSDINGYCHFSNVKDDSYNEIFLEQGQDAYFISGAGSEFYEYGNNESDTNEVEIFTDRSIYRPGQAVYFKAISFYSDKKRQTVVANKNYEITFYDANYKKISSKKLTTNDFGSFSGEFIVPEGVLSGTFSLKVGDFNSLYIRVEEYKRPTFEVTLEKPKTEVNFGEKATFKGVVKAFSGYNVGNAKVKYRIVRNTGHYWFRHYEQEKEIANGITTSKDDGSFEIAFIPEKQLLVTNNFGNEESYTYTIYAVVTDLKGETQQSEQSLSVGVISLFITAEVENKVDKKQVTDIEISTITLNDEKIDSRVKYTLYRLAQTDKYNEKLDEKTVLKIAETKLSGTFETKDKKLKLNLDKVESGRYKLVFTTTDSHGKEVKLEKIFILYGNDDSRPPVKSYVWLQKIKTECAFGETALIQFGTSTKNSSVLYELMQGNKVLKSQWMKFSDEIKTFRVPFIESYGAGVTVMVTFIKDEELFSESVEIAHKVEVKKLTPTLSVFRNKLLPGEKAEWTITIPEGKKVKKMAELLVDMYDASLDGLHTNVWRFDPTFRENVSVPTNWESDDFSPEMNSVRLDPGFVEVKDYQFDQLNWFGLVKYYTKIRTIYSKTGSANSLSFGQVKAEVKASRSFDITGTASNNVLAMQAPPFLKSSIKFTAPIIKKDEEVISVADVKGYDENINTADKIKIRTNFNETAFFYPQLRTDSVGNVKFSFTAPESLTRWNVKMLAHTKDLYFGQGEAQVVTQKDLMVQMNLPRFVRRSDKLVLSANVVNLTDKELKASVRFEMIDPATEKPIVLKDATPKTVTLAANETKAVEWELTEFSLFELVTCKVVAQAGNFSDGEQKYLPVLPDKVLVTESMPLTIRGNQTRTFNFENLLKNGSKVDTKNLLVEFSSNPAWYAVQALPTISTPEDDNALDYFTAYYANSLAAFIANSNPKISATFDRWKKAGGSREALLSNLEKNKELKNMLLEETPWVMAARDETEQKRQIALLFDLNMQKNQAQQYLDKLISLQLPSGGFSWFKGMGESRYITQEIMLNLARLAKMTKSDLFTAYRLPLTAALHYLDLEIAHDFDNLKKSNKNYSNQMSVDNIQLFYLHLRSEYKEIPIEKSAQDAVQFYTSQSEKYWTNFTLYGKAMMAVVANRNGKTQIAEEILKSLKENALKTDELGMYWAKNKPGYFWNERPIGVQAAIIEAFAEISKNSGDVEEMKIWLLKQKQTQRWDSPMSTVDAIYALLNQGGDWLANDSSVKIKVGNSLLQPADKEAGTGYFKETIPVADIRPETGKVTVSKSDKGIGWGAMYWQYYQDLDQIQGQSGSLKVTKKLFVEKISASGKTLLPIEQIQLKKGDKVITRLVITTDRNLEFVSLKDLRASCFEPVNQLSGYEWKEGVGYYQTTKDASTHFFFNYLPKGTYVFEYELWANNSGEFTSGIATIQCQYAPEFVSHTGGERLKIQ